MERPLFGGGSRDVDAGRLFGQLAGRCCCWRIRMIAAVGELVERHTSPASTGRVSRRRRRRRRQFTRRGVMNDAGRRVVDFARLASQRQLFTVEHQAAGAA